MNSTIYLAARPPLYPSVYSPFLHIPSFFYSPLTHLPSHTDPRPFIYLPALHPLFYSSSIHLLIYFLSTRSFVHSLLGAFPSIHLLIPLQTTHGSLTYPPTQTPTHPNTHSPAHPPIRPSVHYSSSLTHLPIHHQHADLSAYPIIYPATHCLTPSPILTLPFFTTIRLPTHLPTHSPTGPHIHPVTNQPWAIHSSIFPPIWPTIHPNTQLTTFTLIHSSTGPPTGHRLRVI